MKKNLRKRLIFAPHALYSPKIKLTNQKYFLLVHKLDRKEFRSLLITKTAYEIFRFQA